MTQRLNFESQFALQPPGSILVLGSDWLGLETALYGRYLGYDVTLWGGRESDETPVGPRWHDDWWSTHLLGNRLIGEVLRGPVPTLPTRCVSPLAVDALIAQGGSSPWHWPETMGQWVEGTLVDLSQTDLLSGRIFPHRTVRSIELVASFDEEGEEVPPDFKVQFEDLDAAPDASADWKTQTFEAIISTVSNDGGVTAPTSADYHFDIDCNPATDDVEMMMRTVQRRITAVFAELADRPSLDLYRPRRV